MNTFPRCISLPDPVRSIVALEIVFVKLPPEFDFEATDNESRFPAVLFTSLRLLLLLLFDFGLNISRCVLNRIFCKNGLLKFVNLFYCRLLEGRS